MKTSFTPGTWNPTTAFVETLIYDEFVQPGCSTTANVKLISKAPEMFDFLKRVVSERDFFGNAASFEQAYREAKHLIAEIEGEK